MIWKIANLIFKLSDKIYFSDEKKIGVLLLIPHNHIRIKLFLIKLSNALKKLKIRKQNFMREMDGYLMKNQMSQN